MTEATTKSIINMIVSDQELAGIYDPYLPLPESFSLDVSKVKAVVLGCDPTNTKTKKRFKTVFGIGDGDDRYFNPIRNNLQRIGLELSDVYVQNLVRNYCKEETAKNKKWHLFAEYWLPEIKKELDALFNKEIPILITAGKIYSFLVTDRSFKKNGYAYCYKYKLIIPPSSNKLGRPVIPFFRHNSYSLKNNYREYKNYLSVYFK